jgi:hypothetical protein
MAATLTTISEHRLRVDCRYGYGAVRREKNGDSRNYS